MEFYQVRKSYLMGGLMYFEITNLSSKGQLVIPSTLRHLIGLKRGTKIGIMTDGKNILLKPLREPEFEAFQELIHRSKEISRKASARKKGRK